MIEKIRKNLKNTQFSGMLLFGCGIFATMPIVALNMQSRSISFFTICFIFYLIQRVFIVIRKRQNDIIFRKGAILFCLWIMLSAFSCIWGLVYYFGNVEWYNNSMIFLVKTLIYLCFILLFLGDGKCGPYICKGLLCGSSLNIIWSGIDVLYYTKTHISLTNVLFKNYIIVNNIRYGSISSFEGSMIRPAGFNTDPASIGLFSPFVFGYGLLMKKPGFIILGVAGCVFSGSTTAVVCCLLTAFAIIFFVEKRVVIRKTVDSSTILINSVLFIVICIVLFRYAPMMASRIGSIASRINSAYIQESSENVRLTYIEEFPTAVLNQGFKVLTGTGFNSAAEGYLKGNLQEGTILNKLKNHLPYDMENLYLAYFFDCGFFGFLLYICLLIHLFNRLRKKIKDEKNDFNVIGMSALLAVLFSSLFYHYTLYSFHILLFAELCKHVDHKFRGSIEEKI